MTGSDLQRAFLALRSKFLDISRGRVNEIERSLSKIISGSDAGAISDALDLIKSEAHTIAGSSGTYGYADVSKSAKDLEMLCIRFLDEGIGKMDEAQIEELTKSVNRVCEESTRMFDDPDSGKMPF